MSQQVRAWKRSFDRWSPEETAVLIEEWAPLYRRRRGGAKGGAGLPLLMRGRARSSRALVAEDWRTVMAAVNSYRVDTVGLDSLRTLSQCKKRVKYLKSQYVKGLAPVFGWPFLSALHAVWADEVGDNGGAGAVVGRGAPAGDAGVTAVHGFGPSRDERDTPMVNARSSSAAAAAEGFVPAADARRGSAVEEPEGAAAAGDASRGSLVEGAASAGDASGTASVAARGGAFVHEEDCRAAAVAINSCLTFDGISPERAHKQCGGRVKPLSDIYEKKPFVGAAAVDEEHGDVGDASCGVSVEGRGAGAAREADRRRAAFVPPPIPKRPRSGTAKPVSSSGNERTEASVTDLPAQALAAGSVDAMVVMKLAQTYKELRTKVLDVEREKAAAAHAGARRRA